MYLLIFNKISLKNSKNALKQNFLLIDKLVFKTLNHLNLMDKIKLLYIYNEFYKDQKLLLTIQNQIE